MSNLAIEQEETVDKVLTKSRMKATVNMVNLGNEQEDIRKFSFEEWKKRVPEAIRTEKFWQLIAYQKALYLYELTWADTEEWIKDVRGQALAKQMIASSDSICANIEEGFGRGFGKQLIYFYTVALGSARETKGRFYRARALLSSQALQERLALASEIIALLITEINRQKRL